MRKSTVYFAFIVFCITALAFLLLVHPYLGAEYHAKSREARIQLVKRLQITDLCLFNEARYTRHLSQADEFSAFQDHPMAFEHFPSGSMVLPPLLLKKKKINHRGTEITED